MIKTFTILFRTTLLVCLMLAVQEAWATDYTFTTAGNWTDPGNWTPSYPGETIPAGHTITIAAACTMDASITTASPVTINAGASVTVTSANAFNLNASLTNNGSFTLNSNASTNIQSGTGSFTHDGTAMSLSGTLTNNGNFTLNAGKTLTVNSEGDYHEKGMGAINGTLTNNGDLNVFAAGTLTIGSGGSFTHAGTLASISGTLLNNGDLMVNALKTVSIQSSGTFTHNGTGATIQGSLTNAGIVNVSASKTLTIGGTTGSFTHSGVSASISGSLVTAASGGSITVSAGATLTINNGGSFAHNGNGSVSISGTFTNNGDFTLSATATSNTFNINSGGIFTHGGISASISRSVISNGSFNVSSGSTLTMNSGATLQANSGTVTVSGILNNSGSCQFIGSTLTIGSGGTLTHNGANLAISAGSISSGGTLTQDGSNANISFGTFTNNGIVTVNAGKTLTVSFGGTFIHDGTSATINGILADANGNGITVSASKILTIASGGSFTHSGNTLTISGTLAVNSSGSFTHNGNNSVSYSGTIANDGTVTVNSGKTLTVSSGGTFTNNGTLTNDGTFGNSGTLNGTGTFNGSITNSSGGTLAPGTSPGCMTFSNLTNSGTLSIEVNGLTACSLFDKLTVSGSATLSSSTLSVSIGYSPTINDVITFIDAGSITGSFTTFSPALPTGWIVQYDSPTTGDVSLKYTVPPANNNCSGAIATTVSANGACSYVSGTTENATLSKAFTCAFGGSEVYVDVWYSFTAPAGGSVTFHSGTGSPFASIYADCNNSSPIATGCIRGSGTVANLTSGNTYYLQVLTSGSSGMAFDFCLEEPGAAPSNNSCSGAIPIDLGNPIPINSLYALTNTLPYCAPFPTLNVPDLWYSFTAPAAGAIGYSFSGGTIVMTVYGGTCAGLTQVACAVPLAGGPPSGLTSGATYYAQLSSIGATTSGTSTITAPNDYTFTGAVSNSFNNAANWMSGAVPGSGNNVTIPAGETCDLDVNFSTTGTATVQSGGTLNIPSGVDMTTNGGTTSSGTIGGGGSITGIFTNNGTVAPGSSPGCMTINGNFTNSASGTLAIEVNGTTACTQYDQLIVTGVATLGGTLSASFGYTPSNGNVITFIDAGSISGAFTTISPTLPAGWSLLPDNMPNPGEKSLSFTSLPIELISFEATLMEGETALLSWNTATELNNEGFDIERSSDGKTWERLTFVTGHGTTLEAQSYTYTDERPLSGTNYYRLRQMDFDGNFEYSPTVSVEVRQEGGGIRLFPNPASGTVTLILETDFIGEAMLTLYGLMGGQVKTQMLSLEGGGPLRTGIDLTELPSGMYLLEIQAGSTQWKERLMIK